MELHDELFYAARAVSRAEVVESLYRFSGASKLSEESLNSPAAALTKTDPDAGASEKTILNGGASKLAEESLSAAALVKTDIAAETPEKKEEPESNGSFVDVSPSDSFYDAVNWAAAKGISEGFPGGFFRPDDKISRQDFAVLYMRYAEAMQLDTAERAPMEGYGDFDKIADYAKDGMAYMVARDLMGGVGGGLMSPRAQLSRAQLAAILSRSR